MASTDDPDPVTVDATGYHLPAFCRSSSVWACAPQYEADIRPLRIGTIPIRTRSGSGSRLHGAERHRSPSACRSTTAFHQPRRRAPACPAVVKVNGIKPRGVDQLDRDRHRRSPSREPTPVIKAGRWDLYLGLCRRPSSFRRHRARFDVAGDVRDDWRDHGAGRNDMSPTS